MTDFAHDIGTLAAVLEHLFQVGKVTSVDDAAGTCRVEMPDADGMESFDLRVLQAKTHKDKQYIMPDVGENVLCVFLPSGNEQGFVLGSYYSASDAVPVTTRDKWHVQFKDGATIEYDRAAHLLSAVIPGDATIKTAGNISATAKGSITGTSDTSISLTAPIITLNGKTLVNGPLTQGGGSNGGDASFKGDLHTTGKITTDDDVVANVSLNTHKHPCPHGGNTGAPNA